ncbi:MAG: 5-methyltetrahydropteroyltriglutamate--homocysteine methyltransferase [Clostridia bacterium]
MLLPTTLVGSYPQPDWLVDKAKLLGNSPPRVRMKEVWRVSPELLREAQDDAVRLALADQERAGIDIVTDGEARRESYFNHFATALSGIDLDRPAMVSNRNGKLVPVPRVVGEIQRLQPVEVDALQFLKKQTEKPVKITVPGPFTLTQLAKDEHYGDERKLALAYAGAVNEELRDLERAGADYLQLDEPYLQAQPDKARKFGVEAIDRALEGIRVPTIVHLCFGYAYVVASKPSGYSFLPELARCRCNQVSIEAAQPNLDPSILKEVSNKTFLLGVLDLGSNEIETVDTVARRIRAALKHVPAERLVIAPDCGMKYLAREVAYAKLAAMVRGAQEVREEIA